MFRAARRGDFTTESTEHTEKRGRKVPFPVLSQGCSLFFLRTLRVLRGEVLSWFFLIEEGAEGLDAVEAMTVGRGHLRLVTRALARERPAHG